ncbi:MAG: hypothetical protein IPJ77_12825 [Planctomycetes bacterium]|nr:hypothetical protein [Planctomycetota bacterium]
MIVGEAQSASLYFRAVKWTVSTPAVSSCHGDGTGLPCPCANTGAPGHGCANSAHASGAQLSASGQASVGADTLTLAATGLTGAFAVFYQGTASIAPVVLDDGIGCVGGVIRRLGTVPVVAAAGAYPEAGDASISVRGAIPASGGTHHYQCFYRNASGLFCPPATSNRTNALTIVWTP